MNEPAKKPGILAALVEPFDPVVQLFDALGTLILLALRAVLWTVRPPYRLGQLLSAMEFIGVQSIFIVALTGAFTGMVFALQMVNSLRDFGAESMVGAIVGIALTRELSPVFTALMVTARGGSAMAAELGNMRVTEQIDALATMGVSPVQYLVTPRMLASVLMMPLLCVLFTCVGMIGTWFVSVHGLGIDPGIFMANVDAYVEGEDFWMGMVKSLVFGLLISIISCNQGFHASGGARGVGQATTRAVVHSAVAVLISNYLVTSWLMGE
ncbi:MAG: ABC transporter permease [Polyangiaceae bacterium]|nr:ABC transporter permease [Polyangiaceae bacterium]